jgi:squalene cyclase/nucleoside phosphorylase
MMSEHTHLDALAAVALERGRDHLRSMQHESGYWKAELQTNVTMDAEDLLMREFLGIRDETIVRQAATWIRSQQQPEGYWNICHGGPPDLSTTVEAYVALRVAGDPPEAEHMKRAAEQVRGMGGLEGARVFTKLWMSLFGAWSWDDVPALPPEVMLLPKWFPLNIYDFASWARQTIVPLTVVASHRPVRPLPFDVDELRVGLPPKSAAPPLTTWAGRFVWLDRALHLYEKRPLRKIRRHAKDLAIEWIIRRQEADGCWGGIQPPWVYSLMALHLEGYAFDHPVMKRGLEALDDFAIVEGDARRFEACQSPVWDTALCMVALRDAGVPDEDPSLQRGAEYLLREEVRAKGDWAVSRPHLAPGGWAFEFENDNYPDIDDTAEVVLALDGLDVPEPARVEGAVGRAIEWTYGMQCRDGGFAAFDVDNTRALTRELPARPRLAAAGAGDGRLVVRALGRQPPLRDRRRGAGADRRRHRARRSRDPPRRRLARGVPERGRRLGRGSALLRGVRLARPRRLDALADGLGAAGTAGGGRARGRCVARHRVAGPHAARRRGLGRAGLHGHRLSRRLLHPLPPVSRPLPGHGARALPAGARLRAGSESLLVAAPLRLEARALRRGGPRLHVVRTGMGSVRAKTAAARLAMEPASALVVAGLCGALDPTLQPGDVVVASSLVEARAQPALADALAAPLRAAGLPVREGAIVSVDRVVHGRERRALAARGALAADMESTWLAAGAAGRPFGVVRVVLDAPRHELWRPGLARNLLSALRTLREVAAVLDNWEPRSAQAPAMGVR